MTKCVRGAVLIVMVIVLSIISINVFFPRPYSELVQQFASQYGVDENLVYAVIKAESGHDPLAISRSGAKGLMQIMDKTGAWGAELCNIQDYAHDRLFDPAVNIQIGTWYLAKLMKQYEGDADLVLAAYNAGSGNVAKWRNNTLYSSDGKVLHTIPFKETEQYIKRVKWYYKIYRMIYRY